MDSLNDWKDYEEVISDIDGRTWRWTDRSETFSSPDFSLKGGILQGPLMDVLEVSTANLACDYGFHDTTKDGDKLHATLDRIFEFDLFEHEGDDRYKQLMREICDSVSQGELVCNDVLCYGNDRLVDLKFSPGKLLLYWKSAQ